MKTDLILNKATIKEIVDEIYAKFMLHTDNISFHFEEHAIQITVFPGCDAEFILPGGPVDVRLNIDEDRWDYIRRHSGY